MIGVATRLADLLTGLVAGTDEPPPECDQGASWLCEQVLDWSDGNESLARIVDAFGVAIILLIATALIARLSRRYVERLIRRVLGPERQLLKEPPSAGRDGATREERNAQQEAELLRRDARITSISRVIAGTTTVVIWTVGLLLVLAELGINIGPLVAGAGLLAAALSFGAQSLVKDVIAGLFVLIEDQYGIGDVIDLDEATGTVEKISLRATVLRGLDGTVWHVPNGQVARVGNFSKLWSVALIDVDVAYDADLEAAGDLLLAGANEVCDRPEWADDVLERPELLGVEMLGADGITLRLVTRVKPGVHWGLQRAMRLAIKETLDGAGVEIPFPQRTVWLRSDDA